MIFTPTPLAGSYVLGLEKLEDERGFFARAFCQQEFSARGLEAGFVQVNNSLSKKRGTLRGMHYQLPPSAEVKIVRCISGALFDVILDLRPESETFGQYFGIELSAENRNMLYIPRGFAHGFITLTADTELLYLVSAFYDKDRERGLRYDDSRFGVSWPISPTTISAKDASYPDFDDRLHLSDVGSAS